MVICWHRCIIRKGKRKMLSEDPASNTTKELADDCNVTNGLCFYAL